MLSLRYILCGITLMPYAFTQLISINGGALKFIAGFGVPIDVDAPGRGLSLGYSIQALYRLPDNSSYFQPYKVLHKRSITQALNRKLVYTYLEPILEKFGMSGKGCVLRLICEMSRVNLGSDFGHLLHVVFTPVSEDVMDTEYMEAYQRGSYESQDCSQLFNCTVPSILNNFVALST